MTSPSKILIVEDEYIVAEDIANVLTIAGHHIVGKVSRAREAVSMAREHKPDLILMDIVLKGVDDGITAAREIRDELGIPVVYLTAYSDRGTLERAKSTHPLAYIVKPFDVANLQTTVEFALERARLEILLRDGNQWLSTMLRSLSDGVISLDTKGDVQFANQAARRLLHPSGEIDPASLVDQQVLECDGCPSSLRSHSTQQVQNGNTAKVECIRRWTESQLPEGSHVPEPIPLALQVFPIANSEGERKGTLVTLRDITLEVERRDRMQKEKEHLEGLVASRTEKLIRQVRRERIAATISEAFGSMGDHSIDDVVSNNLRLLSELLELESVSLLHLDHEGNNLHHWKKDGSSTTSQDCTHRLTGQLELLTKNTEEGILVNLLSPPVPEIASLIPANISPSRAHIMWFFGTAGEVFIFMIHDTTIYEDFPPLEQDSIRGLGSLFATVLRREMAERKQTLLRHRLEQAQRLESIGKLSSGLAHDFKNYLTPIMGFAELIEADPSYAEVGSAEILNAAKSAEGLIRQLLAFSREQELEKQHVCLSTLLKEMEPLLRRVAGSKRFFHCSIAESTAQIWADPSQIKQILMNLVTNARHATCDEDAINVELHELETGMQIIVKDTGTGMSLDVQKRIFEPFYSTKGDDGTGLGLSVVYGIVQQHHGTIQVESAIGEGTRFTLNFPLLKEATPPVNPTKVPVW